MSDDLHHAGLPSILLSVWIDVRLRTRWDIDRLFKMILGCHVKRNVNIQSYDADSTKKLF